MVMAASCYGVGFFSPGTVKQIRFNMKRNGATFRAVLDKNLSEATKDGRGRPRHFNILE